MGCGVSVCIVRVSRESRGGESRGRLAPLPHLPPLMAGKNRDGVRDGAVLQALEMRQQQGVELFVGNAERGALELWADEKITGQQAAGRQEFGDAVAPVGP